LVKLPNQIKVLDCTFRDGGYYTNWYFSKKTTEKYLRAASSAGIDWVEVGFRFLNQDDKQGPFASTTDEFLDSLSLPKGPDYGVMINGADFVGMDTKTLKESLAFLFKTSSESPVSLVRIAINFNDAEEVREITLVLKDLGYKIGLNLMQSQEKSARDYLETSKLIEKWGSVNILYFADSLGTMKPEDIKFISESLKEGWNGNLGFHAHNNKGLALINTITAIENGVNWCDGTLTGMGRGAGNVPTESLLMELELDSKHKGKAMSLHPIVEELNLLKESYKWGSNFYYHYAANHNIHPTYVQTLLSDDRYDGSQALEALKFLSQEKSTSYNNKVLRKSIYQNQKENLGKWDATDWLKNKDVLIVGGGPSVINYKKEILNLIQEKNLETLFLNYNNTLPLNLAKATLVCHEARALLEAKMYKNLPHPLILPMSTLGKLIEEELKEVSILDYSLTLKPESLEVSSTGCTLASPLAAAYALCVATQANSRRIFLVGFDGYLKGDQRNEEMDQLFQIYKTLDNSVELISLAPTNYELDFDKKFFDLLT